ncbi:hypothetical protein B1C78_09170 [Thioalkalivibrio denitrificans]|uniref:MlaB-like STAS domain-containing protein n=1 Tax=Thioalkalivibrio denitrificans TaxID=108003 RepID=A0A1V3NHJ6_9GAMM|nr:STAS domain-containing protein [Thioalkalivibrio denitrificans]OOG24246.1 hypothetical protein B1C78_09170 [Thioalkalivibrio denitrificans]
MPEREQSRAQGDATCVSLPESMDITSVRAVREQLLAALGAGVPVELHAHPVSRTDTAGLQLLVAFLREAHARQVPVSVHAAGDVLPAAVRRLGVESLFGPAIRGRDD